MIYAVIIQFAMMGQPMLVFRPVESVNDCREMARVINERDQKETAHCGLFFLDKIPEE